jgi:hypothetical protein
VSNPRLATIVLTFIVVGPPVGAVVFMSFISAHTAASGVTPIGLPMILNGLPVIVVFGYILGVLPAFVSSLAMSTLVRRDWRLGRRLLAAIPIGALASTVILGFLAFGPQGGVPWSVFIANLATTGAAAAVASTLALQLFNRPKRSAA